MQAAALAFKLAEPDEQVVRTYTCTRNRRWFNPPSFGYLTVTNKRVVFHSASETLSGRSLLLSEMPLDDVAGLSTYDGLSINWLIFALFAIGSYLVTSVVASTPFRFLVTYEVGLLLLVPFVAIWLLSGSLLSEEAKRRVFQTIDDLRVSERQVSRDLQPYVPYTCIAACVGLAVIAWRIVFNSPLAYTTPVAALLLLLAVYGFIFITLFGRQQTFSLVIGSKTTKGSGILVPGNSFNPFFGQSSSAWQFQSPSPGADASQVVRELGALVMDIQQLGDLGIEKWKR